MQTRRVIESARSRSGRNGSYRNLRAAVSLERAWRWAWTAAALFVIASLVMLVYLLGAASVGLH